MRNEEALAQHTLDMGFDGKRFHGVDTKRVAPAIVFLHGNSSRWQHWLPQLRFFAKAYRVVAFDQLGFGASSPLPADYSMANQCEDTLRLLAELGIDRCHVVGISMGAAGAQMIALRSDVATSVCLAGSFRYDRFHPSVVKRFREITRAATENPVASPAVVAQTLFHPDFLRDHPSEVAGVVEQVLGSDFAAAGLLSRPASLGEVGRIPPASIVSPSLVVAADSDYFVPIEAARDLHDAIPGARWHEIRRCGHAMSLQCAEEFNQVLQKFYASI